MEGICMSFLDPSQFSDSSRDVAMATNFCVIADFFAWSHSISGSAGPIFTIFAPYGRFELQMISHTFFFRYLKGRCHGYQFCGKITYPLHLSLWHLETEWDSDTLVCALTA